MSFKHSIDFIVEEREVTSTGQITLHALADRMEQAATEHAANLGVSVERLVSNGVAWVLTRMFIKIDRMPEIYEHLVLYTWPVSINRLQFRRDFELVSDRGEIIAKATTQWVIIDLFSRKVIKIPTFVSEAVLTNDAEALPEPNWKLHKVEDARLLYETKAEDDDIDINKHVNNVRYVKWLYEAMPDEIRDRIKTFAILYRAEALLGDEIEARGKHTDDGFNLALYRKSEGTEFVRSLVLTSPTP